MKKGSNPPPPGPGCKPPPPPAPPKVRSIPRWIWRFDPYKVEAAHLYGVPEPLVTVEMRDAAKRRFYCIMYNGRGYDY